jgi:hypothetical protein
MVGVRADIISYEKLGFGIVKISHFLRVILTRKASCCFFKLCFNTTVLHVTAEKALSQRSGS